MSHHYTLATHNLPPRHLLSIATGFAVASLTGAACAQETTEQPGQPLELGKISIDGVHPQGFQVEQASSPKQTASLLDTPQTVSVIPQAVYKQQGARNLNDVLKNTPGISFNAGENGFSTGANNFSMRGFDTSGNIFVDGARDSGVYNRDVFNLEQVEVAKGPAADNGRGGAGGYVNLVTKTPERSDFINGSASYGFDRYDAKARKRTTLDTNQTLDDSSAFRLNLLLEDSGVAGREHAEKNSWGLAPSLAFGLGTGTRTIVAYEHVEQNDRPDWGVPGASAKGMDRYDPSTSGAGRDAFYGLASDYDDTTTDALLVRLEHDLADGLTLSNQTRLARVDRQARYTVPTGYIPASGLVTAQTQFYDRTNTSLSNLTNLASTFKAGSVQHQVAAGLELSHEKSAADRFDIVNPGSTGIFDPDEHRAGPIKGIATQNNRIAIDTVALYVYDTLQFNEQWQMTGGLRFENYQVSIDSRTAAGAPAGPLDGYEDSEFSVGGKLGLVYKPARNGSIYAAYGFSTQPPGSYLSNPDISRPGDNAFPGFVEGADPIKSHNYELGTKWDLFDGRLSTTAALFHTVKTNVAISGRDAGETSDTLKGYGKQIAQGLELSVAGQITPVWNVFGGLMLLDTERRHSAYLDQVRRNANPADYGTNLRTSGDELAFTPRFSGNLWTTYQLPIGLTLGTGVQHLGSSYLGRPDDANRIIPNGTFGKLPSYTTYNAMASYEVSKNLDLRLNVDNLANKQYVNSSNWAGSRVMLGAPRTFLVSADVAF